MSNNKTQHSIPKNNNTLIELGFNIIIPVLVMTQLNGPEQLGPLYSIAVALMFPLSYGVYELARSKKVNFFSVLGIVSVLLTGTISLLELPAEYIAIKEAAIPALIGLAVLISQFTNRPLVKLLILNDALFDWDKLNATLIRVNAQDAFARSLRTTSYIVTGSFFLSSMLNYGLAKYLLVAEPGTSEYTAQLGQMTAWSYPVIVIPSMLVLLIALFYLFGQIKRITGESFESYVKS